MNLKKIKPGHLTSEFTLSAIIIGGDLALSYLHNSPPIVSATVFFFYNFGRGVLKLKNPEAVSKAEKVTDSLQELLGIETARQPTPSGVFKNDENVIGTIIDLIQARKEPSADAKPVRVVPTQEKQTEFGD